MRRRPGIAALENVVRAISAQPRLVRRPGRALSVDLADSLLLSDSVSAVLTLASIPSAEAFGTPTTSVGPATETDQALPITPTKHTSGRARVSGGGPHAKGHASHGPTPRERYEWPMQSAGAFGTIGFSVGALLMPADPTTGGAVVGLIGVGVGWVWAYSVERWG